MKFVLMALAVALSYLIFSRKTGVDADSADPAKETDAGAGDPPLPELEQDAGLVAADSADHAARVTHEMMTDDASPDEAQRDGDMLDRVLGLLQGTPQCATPYQWDSDCEAEPPQIRTTYDPASGRIALEMDLATFARHAEDEVSAVSYTDAVELLIGDTAFAVIGKAKWNPAKVSARVLV